MKRGAIVAAMKAVLLETNNNMVMWGDDNLLLSAADRAGMKRKGVHPLNVCKRVCDALSRDAAKTGATFRVHLTPYDPGRVARVFTLIEGSE